MDADALPDAGDKRDGIVHDTGTHRDSATLPIIEPTIRRDEVGVAGERIGAVAYPYRVADAHVHIERPLLAARHEEYVVSVDRCRRLAIRADVVPNTEQRTIEDVLVLPSKLTNGAADKKARDAAFKWTLRRFALRTTPTVELRRTVDAYKLFWLVETPDGTILVDSVRNDRQPLSA